MRPCSRCCQHVVFFTLLPACGLLYFVSNVWPSSHCCRHVVRSLENLERLVDFAVEVHRRLEEVKQLAVVHLEDHAGDLGLHGGGRENVHNISLLVYFFLLLDKCTRYQKRNENLRIDQSHAIDNNSDGLLDEVHGSMLSISRSMPVILACMVEEKMRIRYRFVVTSRCPTNVHVAKKKKMKNLWANQYNRSDGRFLEVHQIGVIHREEHADGNIGLRCGRENIHKISVCRVFWAAKE